MGTETFSGMAARVKVVQRTTAAERLGLLPGDIILKLGRYEPLEGVETPSVLDDISSGHEWIVVQRDTVVFRLSPKGGADGAILEPHPLPEDIVWESEGAWKAYHCSIRNLDSMLLIPERISPIWWSFPVIAYGQFRLWKMMAANLFLYGIGWVTSPLAFGVVYASSIMILISGGPYLLRDTATKDGFLPRGRIALAKASDVAALEMVTGAILRLSGNTK
jgi:hypothetical protein